MTTEEMKKIMEEKLETKRDLAREYWKKSLHCDEVDYVVFKNLYEAYKEGALAIIHLMENFEFTSRSETEASIRDLFNFIHE